MYTSWVIFLSFELVILHLGYSVPIGRCCGSKYARDDDEFSANVERQMFDERARERETELRETQPNPTKPIGPHNIKDKEMVQS